MTSPLVAVVGGGIAGLSAAGTLAAGGLRVTVFDRGRNPGGRVSTRDRGDRTFDHGAQYFTARDERFKRAVSGWLKAGHVALWGGHVVTIEGERIEPARPAHRFVGVPGMRTVAERMADGLDVRSGLRVVSLDRAGVKWVLRGPDEDLGEFDAVVVATPAPQVKSMVATASPELASVAAAAAYDPCWAVMLGTEEPLDVGYDAAFVRGGPLSWISNDGSRPGRPVGERWVLHAGPGWSRQHLESSGDEVAEALLDAVSGVVKREITPSFLKAHRWKYATALAGGGTSHFYDRYASIGACGDWCRGARVEGAFLSGLSLAEHMVQELSAT